MRRASATNARHVHQGDSPDGHRARTNAGRIARRRIGSVLVTAFLLLGVLAVAAITYLKPLAYLKPQRLVDIGGRRLNLYCTGSGSPAVVLDAGFGSPMWTWALVIPALAKHSLVCAYDRAGMGFSDPSVMHRDADGIAAELHALVHRAGIPTPFVLVGHSIAGLYTRAYVARYPADVAGLVLVDPSFPFQEEAFETVSPAVRSFMHAAAEQTQFNPSLTAELRCFLGDRDGRELDSLEVAHESRSLGALPLIVLTAGNIQSYPGLSSAQAGQMHDVWTRGHDRVAALSSRGVNRIVPGAGHYIQLYRPSAVVSAVDEIVDQVRYR